MDDKKEFSTSENSEVVVLFTLESFGSHLQVFYLHNLKQLSKKKRGVPDQKLPISDL